MIRDLTPTLDDIEVAVRTAILRGLPGVDAQLRMAPRPAVTASPQDIDTFRARWDPYRPPDGLRDAAALLFIYPHDHVPHVLLTLRGARLRKHTGQVSLPGGGIDPDESIETAALREAAEEVGIAPVAVHLLGRLTPTHIPASGYRLHPVVGTADHRPDMQPAEWEVARILEVPLPLLFDPSIAKLTTQKRDLGGYTVELDVPFFEIDGEQVWGATAMILAEFVAILQMAGSPSIRSRSLGAGKPGPTTKS